MNFHVNKQVLYFWSIVIIFSFIVGNRGATNDTMVYYDIFKNINSFDLKNYYSFYAETGVEIGWGWYSKIISYISNQAYFLFTIFSFLTFYVIYKSARCLKINYLYVMFFYLSSGFFLMQQFMQIRQGFAVPAVILGSLLFLNKKYLCSLFFFVIGTLFHQVVFAYIAVFLLYILINNNFSVYKNKNYFYLLNFLIIFLGFISARYILLPIMSGFFERLQSYAESDYAEVVGFFSLSNVKYYLQFILIILLVNTEMLKSEFFKFMVFIFVIGLTLRIAFFDFGILSGRLSNVFLFIEIFLMPYILYNRLPNKIFYPTIFIYSIFIFIITWFFQAQQFITDYYFLPLD